MQMLPQQIGKLAERLLPKNVRSVLRRVNRRRDVETLMTFAFKTQDHTGDALVLPAYFRDHSATRLLRKRAKAVKVVYGFIFNHELDLLEVLLHTLADVVDSFILVESTYTHYGKQKELYYQNNKERYHEFASRIMHVILDDKPTVSQATMTWEHEEFSRASIGGAAAEIEDLRDDDVFIVVDVDEIVDPRVVYFLKTTEGYPNITKLSFRNCCYGFYWQGQPCILPVATSVGFLRGNHFNANLIRGGAFESTDYWQIGNDHKWAGWHASWCLRIADLQIKLESALKGDGVRWGDYADKMEYDYLLRNVREGRWFGDAVKLQFTHPDTFYFAPDYVMSNKGKFGYLLSPDLAH